MTKNSLEKYDEKEPIRVGDLISYWPETNKVTRSRIKHWKQADINKVIGVCTEVKDNIIIDNEKLEELMDMYKNQ